jgi:hypothetical protein
MESQINLSQEKTRSSNISREGVAYQSSEIDHASSRSPAPIDYGSTFNFDMTSPVTKASNNKSFFLSAQGIQQPTHPSLLQLTASSLN